LGGDRRLDLAQQTPGGGPLAGDLRDGLHHFLDDVIDRLGFLRSLDDGLSLRGAGFGRNLLRDAVEELAGDARIIFQRRLVVEVDQPRGGVHLHGLDDLLNARLPRGGDSDPFVASKPYSWSHISTSPVWVEQRRAAHRTKT